MFDGFDFFPDDAPIWVPILASILTGAAIGFEREFMSKSAGLRTHTLLCFSCTLLMLAATHQADWHFNPISDATIVADPTRMAHGILAGIGFLGAGVIFRQGGLVHGLTTAAALWMTSALGILYGAGLWELALTGAVTTLIVLVIFRVFHKIVPDRIEAALTVVLADREALGAVRDRMGRLSLAQDHEAIRIAGESLTLGVTLWFRRGDEVATLAQELSGLPGVSEVRIAPVRISDRVTI